MNWGAAWVVWLLAAVPLAIALRWWWGHRVVLAQRGVGHGQPRHVSSLRSLAILRQVLLWTGLLLALVALAQPRWGAIEEQRQAEGANIALLLDCSRSMLAEDQFPDRLQAARTKAIDLLRAAPEHRLALIPFAAFPLRRSPLTGDQIALERLLAGCTPDLFKVQGTAIGTAVDNAVDFLVEQGDRSRAIIILSDGVDPDTEAVAAAGRKAAVEDIPVYGIFLGDPEREVRLLIDGREEIMRADRSTLDTLADVTGAVSVNIRPDDEDIRVLQRELAGRITTTAWQEEQRVVASEQFHLLLWPALVLIALGSLLPTGRRQRPMWEVAG